MSSLQKIALPVVLQQQFTVIVMVKKNLEVSEILQPTTLSTREILMTIVRNLRANLNQKVMLAASPDERHCEDLEFQKYKGGVLGFSKYFPLWS
jgi:hypothetical protein